MARSEDFADGAERVRQPQFETVQSQHSRNFRAMSVLDLPSALPNQNGMGAADLQRRMMGFHESVTGRSESTFDRQLWLHEPQNTPRTSRPKED